MQPQVPALAGCLLLVVYSKDYCLGGIFENLGTRHIEPHRVFGRVFSSSHATLSSVLKFA